MTAARAATVRTYFEALTAGDLDAVFAHTTEDLVVDRRNSTGPFSNRTVGLEDARAGFHAFRDAWGEGEDSWRSTIDETRSVGRAHVVVETIVQGRGRASGIEVGARGGWAVRLEGELVAEVVLHQSFAEALLVARRAELRAARLYFVCDALPNGADPGELLEAAVRGGADVIQLREKAPRCAEELIAFAEPFARVAREHGALFFLNDEPALVESCDADGVHVGQDDAAVGEARAEAGPGAVVGLSTHSPEQFDAALAASGSAAPDQLSVGPVWETPTKAGRPAAGLALVEHASRAAAKDVAWFAIGGIDASNIGEVVAAGARRVVVVRAIRDSADPEVAARELRSALG